jgi:hypothetical protein
MQDFPSKSSIFHGFFSENLVSHRTWHLGQLSADHFTTELGTSSVCQGIGLTGCDRGIQGLWQQLLLMEEILHQLIDGLSHYSYGFNNPRWCRISSIHIIPSGEYFQVIRFRIRKGPSSRNFQDD